MPPGSDVIPLRPWLPVSRLCTGISSRASARACARGGGDMVESASAPAAASDSAPARATSTGQLDEGQVSGPWRRGAQGQRWRLRECGTRVHARLSPVPRPDPGLGLQVSRGSGCRVRFARCVQQRGAGPGALPCPRVGPSGPGSSAQPPIPPVGSVGRSPVHSLTSGRCTAYRSGGGRRGLLKRVGDRTEVGHLA